MALTGCRPASVQQADVELESCRWRGYDGDLLCGVATVRENPEDRSGRTIDLEIAVLPRTGEQDTGEVMTFLAGGGVLPATRYVPFLGRAVPALRERFDILLVNQRGSGGASELDCTDLPRELDVIAGETTVETYLMAVTSCRDSLAVHADLAQYTTDRAADDLDAIRRALGYERLSIWGASYGTKAARVFARRHPEATDVLVLHGVVPLSFSMWPDLAPSGLAALDRLLARCEGDADCSAAYPDVSGSLDSLLVRLDREPVEVVAGPDSTRVVLSPETLAVAVTAPLAEMAVARRLPRWIDAAFRGDYGPLADALAQGGGGVARGTYFSIACAEEFGRPPQQRRALRSAGPVAGADERRQEVFAEFGSLERDRRVCQNWPKRLLPVDYWAVVETSAPALVLSGEWDFITPPSYGDVVASALPRATHVTLPDRSHNDLDPCVVGMIEGFLLERGEVVNGGCLEKAPPFTFDQAVVSER